MNELLSRAKRIQRDQAECTNLWVKLSFLQDLIAEIERLELVIAAHSRGGPRELKEVK